MKILLLVSMLVAGTLAMTGRRHATQGGGQPPQATTEAPVQATYHKLTAQEAKARLDAEPAITLVDVRTEEEYREKRIAHSMLIPDYDIEKLAPTMLPHKNATIFLYCRSGRRSRGAAMKLVAMGYTQVYDFGGIIDWPYDTVSGQ